MSFGSNLGQVGCCHVEGIVAALQREGYEAHAMIGSMESGMHHHNVQGQDCKC